MFAHRQAGDKCGERIEIEISGEDAAKLSGGILYRQRAGNAGYPLPIEHIGRQPHEPTGALRTEIERPLARVVSAILVGSQDLPRAVGKDLVFFQFCLSVHNAAMVDVRPTFWRTVGAGELASLVAVADPA